MSAAPLPPSWTTTTVGQLADSIQYGHTASATVDADGPRFLRITDIQDGAVDWDTVPSCDIEPSEIEKYRLAPGDLVFARTGATTGKSFLIRDCPVAVFASYLIRLRMFPVVQPGFIYYFFQSIDYWRQIEAGKRGIGQPNVNASILAQIKLPLAPVAEQVRIVAKIEELFSDLDAGVAALERVKANLKRYRAAVLKGAVEGRLTEDWRRRHCDTEPASKLLERILAERRAKWEQDQLRKFTAAGKTPPNGWKERYQEPSLPDMARLTHAMPVPDAWAVASTEQVAAMSLGKMLDREKHQKGQLLPYLRNVNVRWGWVDMSDLKEMYFESDELDRFGLLPGDVLVCEGGEPGRAAVWTEMNSKMTFQKALHRVGCSPHLDGKYLVTVLEDYAKSGRLERFFTGSTIKHLTGETFATLPLPLPPIAEQAEIVAEVDRRLSVADAAERQVEYGLERAARLRQAILTRAFEGKLVPQDPNDEAVSVLFQRIESTMPRKQNPRTHSRPSTRTKKGAQEASSALPADFVTNILGHSPAIRLVAIKYAGAFRSLSPLDLELRPGPSNDKSTSPLCLVGLNGSGKSNLIELIGQLLCDIELALIGYVRVPQVRRNLQHPPFALKYELRTDDKTRALVTLVGGKGEPLRAVVSYRDAEFPTTFSRDIQQLLPRWIIAYSSGLNETISLPFMRNRAYYSEEVSNHAGKETDTAPVRDIRTVFLDYECNAAILLSNYIFQYDKHSTLFREALRIDSLTSFALTYRLKRPKGGSTVRLTRELNDILARFRSSATSIEERPDVQGATLRFDLEKGAAAALRKQFTNAIDFFQCIHKWALLNSLSLSGTERKVYLHTSASAGLLAQPPTVSREDQIFRVDDLQVRLMTPSRVIPYAGLSDGEHQFIQIFGSIMLFDGAGTLFLLDEPETHFNPQWRRQFVEYLNRLKTAIAQDFVVSTHSPFVVSGCRGNGVFLFRRKGDTISIAGVEFETFGSSYELLLMKLFDLDTTIAERAAHEMRDILKSKDPKQIESAAAQFGDSWEKQLIYRRIAELEQENKSA